MIDAIIPSPKKITKNYDEKFLLNGKIKILIDNEENINKIEELINDNTNLEISSDARRELIFIKDMKLNSESYIIDITKKNIQINYSDHSGFIYALSTMKQLFYSNSKYLPNFKIEDSPKYGHRECLVDSVRHFMPINELKRIIRILSFYKFNVMHWHLTDDQGWRIEIDKYDKLTSIGSYREKSLSGKYYINQEYPTSGFYTKNEIREIINYAKEYGIEIMPEFDIPGHVTALLTAYPELSCFQNEVEVSTKSGVHEEILCVSKDATKEMVLNIFDEFIELFPFKYIHIGGDEVRHTNWEKCPNCSKLMKDLDLETTMDLQTYFINMVAEYIRSKGKEPIVWNDAVCNENIVANIPFIYWNPENNLEMIEKIIDKGHHVIDLNFKYLYLDYPNGVTPLKDVYDYETIFKKESVIGMGCTLWGELIPNSTVLNRQIFPRICAVSENAWSSKEKDFDIFFEKVLVHQKMVNFLDIKVKNMVIVKPNNSDEIFENLLKRWDQR